ncbi:hypothetical protein M2451_003784 [Dysgonomonas sp. PFB1-18]|uniref:hypothetical protein n=1 Tax=unclassified Dysgonomonas TaxID=2630389 RepID=UPI0024734870|nr:MULTISPECIES: hypothetical protein [unclassified Dysgonomonas]MDH6310920.1 hypothetical protein [Dysgonomonas sp. PF1-14]MDH6340865.1 hypothetical protein [Dysgonomonas sp. PF1-16]MDH6382443.1 hypothetical protein [Dysgonomonas sp. PFB1-18]MDH6399792.1 hypothetical protein [Dysgonomonas sp. PF1-23]
MANYKNEINRLDKDILSLKIIVDTPWRKESELEQLKSELSVLDRKIQRALSDAEKKEFPKEEHIELIEEEEVILI